MYRAWFLEVMRGVRVHRATCRHLSTAFTSGSLLPPLSGAPRPWKLHLLFFSALFPSTHRACGGLGLLAQDVEVVGQLWRHVMMFLFKLWNEVRFAVAARLRLDYLAARLSVPSLTVCISASPEALGATPITVPCPPHYCM